MKWIYDDGGRNKYYKGNTNDCVCRAIAIANNLNYKKVYDLINNYSKNNKDNSNSRIGVSKNIIFKILTDLGWTWIPTMKFGTGCKVHLKEDELPNDKVIIAKLSKHLTCIINGIIHDTYDPSRNGRRCVYGFFVKDTI